MVKILVSFMFATEKEMGYDPYVTRHSPIHYVYEIENRFFRTEGVIVGHRSNNITGHMARIWSAREVNSNEKDASVIGKEECVLKDVWLDAEAPTETEVQSAIFDDIERFWAEDPPADKVGLEPLRTKHRELVISGQYKEYFLTHVVHQIGETTKPYNDTSFKFRPGLFTASAKPIAPGSSTRSKSHRHNDGLRETIGHANWEEQHCSHGEPVYDRKISSKRQYRVVFREKCEATVGNLATLGEAMDVLQQILIRKCIHPTCVSASI